MSETRTAVVQAVREAIRERGPITFAEFMELALYGPGGFYEVPPVGLRGDFLTSPHVHPVFGELLAAAIRELWVELDTPIPLRVAEVGAGDGTLARQILAAAGDLAIDYTAVERSPGARILLGSIGGIGLQDRLMGPVDVVVCNELLDNLPFRVLRDGLEVRVGMDRGRPAEILVEPDPDLAAFAAAVGREQIVPVGALAFIEQVARTLERGYALMIDYGGVGTPGGRIHGYRGHTVVEDVIAEPGANDITVGVDLELIAEHAASHGLFAFPTVTQRDALQTLGLDRWLDGELARQHEALDARAGIEAVRTWSGRGLAASLADPAGLGRFRWLLLATPGLPEPPWLERATVRSADRAL